MIGLEESQPIATVVDLINNPSFERLTEIVTNNQDWTMTHRRLIDLVPMVENPAQEHRDTVAQAQTNHLSLRTPWMTSIFNLKPIAASDSGSVAQMVSSGDTVKHYE